MIARTPDDEEDASRYPVDGGPVTRGEIPPDELAGLIAGIPTGGDQDDDVQHLCGCGCGTVVPTWDGVCPRTLAEIITRSLDALDRAVADATRLGAPLPGLRTGDARAAAIAVDMRRRFTDTLGGAR